MAKKKIIFSTDTGNNGMKTVVGEKREDGLLEQLFVTYNNSDIIRYNRTKISNVSENALYIVLKDQQTKEEYKYIAGNAAKTDYLTQLDSTDKAIPTDFYTNSEISEIDYKRFTTEEFAMLHLAVLYEAVDKLAGMSEYADILTNPENYETVVEVLLPNEIATQNAYQSYIKSYINNNEDHKMFTFSLYGFDKMEEVPEVIANAKVLFDSQVFAAAVCEISSYDVEESEMKKMLPMLVFDCGGKTDGIATITPTFDLGEKSESNRDYSITRICEATAEEIFRSKNYRIRPEQIEARATSDDFIIEDLNEKGEPVSIDVKKIYAEELEKAIKGLYEYTKSNYGHELYSSKSYLIAGGAGELYYNKLAQYIKADIKEAFGEEAAERRNYLLAKGKYGELDNGSIYSVAVGGFELAERAFL